MRHPHLPGAPDPWCPTCSNLAPPQGSRAWGQQCSPRSEPLPWKPAVETPKRGWEGCCSLLEVDVLVLPVPSVCEVAWIRLCPAGEQSILGDVDSDVFRRGNDERRPWREQGTNITSATAESGCPGFQGAQKFSEQALQAAQPGAAMRLGTCHACRAPASIQPAPPTLPSCPPLPQQSLSRTHTGGGNSLVLEKTEVWRAE